MHADGSVTIFVGKVDIGDGRAHRHGQLVGEARDAPAGAHRDIEGDTALTPNQGATAGSYGIARGVQLRRAAATARQALLAQAAQRLGRSVGDLEIADGVVRATDRPRHVVNDLARSGR